MRAIGLMLTALLFAAGRGNADDTISVGFDTTNVPTGYVTFTNSGTGGKTTEDVYIGPFTNVTDTSNAGAVPSTMFCIDLWHNLNGGQSFQGTVASATAVASQLTFPYSGYTPTVGDPQLTSQLNYLGNVYRTLASALTGTALADAQGAVQLGIWHLIDTQFAVSGISDNSHGQLSTDYQGTGSGGILGLLGGGSSQTIEGINLAAWSSGGTYSAGTLALVDRTINNGAQAGVYQDLIGWQGSVNNQSITPEPSTMAIGGLGALAFLGYGLRRRKASDT